MRSHIVLDGGKSSLERRPRSRPDRSRQNPRVAPEAIELLDHGSQSNSRTVRWPGAVKKMDAFLDEWFRLPRYP